MSLGSRDVARALAVAVSITGSVVMVGWILDIDALKSILPTWVTMKFSTALSFTLSGITLYFMSHGHPRAGDAPPEAPVSRMAGDRARCPCGGWLLDRDADALLRGGHRQHGDGVPYRPPLHPARRRSLAVLPTCVIGAMIYTNARAELERETYAHGHDRGVVRLGAAARVLGTKLEDHLSDTDWASVLALTDAVSSEKQVLRAARSLTSSPTRFTIRRRTAACLGAATRPSSASSPTAGRRTISVTAPPSAGDRRMPSSPGSSSTAVRCRGAAVMGPASIWSCAALPCWTIVCKSRPFWPMVIAVERVMTYPDMSGSHHGDRKDQLQDRRSSVERAACARGRVAPTHLRSAHRGRSRIPAETARETHCPRSPRGVDREEREAGSTACRVTASFS